MEGSLSYQPVVTTLYCQIVTGRKSWCTSDFLISHQLFPVLLDVPRVVAHDLLELGIPLLRILRQ
jgi:hypothetical protein